MTNAMEPTATTRPPVAKKEPEEDLSFEEKRLKNDCDRLVTRIITGAINVTDELNSINQANLSLYDETDPNTLANASSDEIRKHALTFLLNALRSATSSLSAIPKSIKFLRNHFTTLQLFYEDPFKLNNPESRKLLALVLSVVATSVASDNNLILHYYLESSREPLSEWGLEYLRALAREIAKEYLQITISLENMLNNDMEDESQELEDIDHQAELDQLIIIAKEIIQVYFKNSNNLEAVDLAIEVQITPFISQFMHHSSVYRICSYLVSCAQYIPNPQERDDLLKTAFEGFTTYNYVLPALQVAIDFYNSSPARRELGQEFILQICAKVQSAKEDNNVMADQDQEPTPVIDKTAEPTRANPNFTEAQKKVIITPQDVQGIYRQIGYTLATFNILFPALEEYDTVYQVATNADKSVLFRKVLEEFGASKPRAVYNVLEPVPRRSGQANLENSLQNFVSAFVNGLINCGSGKELLFSQNDEAGNSLKSDTSPKSYAPTTNFLNRLKAEHRCPSIASLGLVHLWDVEEGFSLLDVFESSTDTETQAGLALAYGVLSCGVNSELNASVALLSEKVESSQPAEVRNAGAFGLGLARLGTGDDEVIELLTPILVNDELSIESIAHAALGLGLTCLGTARDDVAQLLFQSLVTMNAIIVDEEESAAGGDVADQLVNNAIKTSIATHNQSALRIIALSLALVYAGTGTAANSILSEIQENFEMHPLSTYFIILVTTFAFVATSSVEKIQSLVITCSSSLYEDEEAPAALTTDDKTEKSQANTTKDSKSSKADGAKKNTSNVGNYMKYIHQDAALLGLAGLACGDSVTTQMLQRLVGDLAQTSDLNIRRTIPFALALLFASDPNITVTGQIFKMAHDQDEIVARNSCLALGFIGFGTGNSKLNENITYLLKYFANEQNHRTYTQIAQGMLYAGNNLLTVAPKPSFFSLTNKTTCALLLAFFHIACDVSNNLLSKRQHLWLLLTPLIKSRVTITVDADGNLVSIPIRIGQGVDIVGQPGNPRPLTGFQTQPSPVVLNINQAAEIGTDEHLVCAAETNVADTVVVKPAPPKV